jgi:hypothetical protein
MRGNSVLVSPTQFAPIHEALRTQCQQLGMSVPALYITDSAITEPVRAYSAWKQDYIVLNTKYLPDKFEEMMDVIDFLLGSELGRIRLGHTKWWDELLLAYISKLPLLRNPLTHFRTFSRDYYAAFLSPHALRGLVVVASGRRMLAKVNIPEYIEQTKQEHGSWLWLSEITRKLPNTSTRIKALYKSGLLQFDEAQLLSRDLR